LRTCLYGHSSWVYLLGDQNDLKIRYQQGGREDVMNISSKSWHYKAACIASYNFPSNNLCGYFREVMAGMFLMTFGAIVVAGCLYVRERE